MPYLLNNTDCPAIPVGAELTYLRPAFEGDWYGYRNREIIIKPNHVTNQRHPKLPSIGQDADTFASLGEIQLPAIGSKD